MIYMPYVPICKNTNYFLRVTPAKWHSTWHIFLTLDLKFYLTFSDIVSGILSSPLHPELVICCSGPGALHESRREGVIEWGVALLSKSRDPHLAGGEKHPMFIYNFPSSAQIHGAPESGWCPSPRYSNHWSSKKLFCYSHMSWIHVHIRNTI